MFHGKKDIRESVQNYVCAPGTVNVLLGCAGAVFGCVVLGNLCTPLVADGCEIIQER